MKETDVHDRIPWDRYGGDDIEAVVAMFINTEHPDSVRITPSRGDGGVDILDRGAADDGGDVVYQVKRYSEPLTPKQQPEVEKSLKRLLHPEEGDPRWKSLQVTTWRLVTPWDPTPEAEQWLQELAAPYGVRPAWDGLTYIDRMAAGYPHIVDYYLHGNRTAMQEAYESVMALMAPDDAPNSKLSTGFVMDRVAKALRTLDVDPHYAYETRFGHGEPPPPPARPRLVVSLYRIDPTASTWYAVDILARCAASTEVRPIVLQGRVTAQAGSEHAAAMKDFVEYGTPFTSADGGFSGEIDIPGGLGGPLSDATIRISPVDDADVGQSPDLRLEVLDPQGKILAETHVTRVERSAGTVGVRVVLREVNGVFKHIQRFDLAEQTSVQRFDLLPLEGKPVSVVRPGVEFLAAFHSPNMVRVSSRHTPAQMGLTEAIPEVDTAPFERLARVLRLLDELQQHTASIVAVPDLSAAGQDQQAGWMSAVRILRGEEVELVPKDEHQPLVEFDLDAGIAPSQEPFSLIVPLNVKVGDQLLNLGQVHLHLANPVLLDSSTSADGQVTTYRFTTSDRCFRYSLPKA